MEGRTPWSVDRYTYTVAWSAEDHAYVSRVAEFPSLAAHGDTIESALIEIRNVLGAVIEDLAASGEPVPEPFGLRRFSGRFNVRLSPELHRDLAIEASRQGVSLNQLVVQKLASR
jgi:predicted HicB family RNase H-like nuclease